MRTPPPARAAMAAVRWLRTEVPDALRWLVLIGLTLLLVAAEGPPADPPGEMTDSLSEAQLMQLLAYSGQRGAALKQYENCSQIFLGELGVEPTEATKTLYQQIKSGELQPPQQEHAHPLKFTTRPPPFREEEFEGVEVILGSPNGWDHVKYGECGGLPIMRVGDIVEVSKDRLSYDGVCQLYSICSKGEFHYSAFARDERYRVEQVEKSPLGTYIYLDRKPGRFNVVNFDLVQTKEDTWLEREERARRMMGLGPAVSRIL